VHRALCTPSLDIFGVHKLCWLTKQTSSHRHIIVSNLFCSEWFANKVAQTGGRLIVLWQPLRLTAQGLLLWLFEDRNENYDPKTAQWGVVHDIAQVTRCAVIFCLIHLLGFLHPRNLDTLLSSKHVKRVPGSRSSSLPGTHDWRGFPTRESGLD